MQAICFKEPGGPEKLYLGQIPKPEPKNGEVLVKVYATALNRADVLQVNHIRVIYMITFKNNVKQVQVFEIVVFCNRGEVFTPLLQEPVRFLVWRLLGWSLVLVLDSGGILN